MTEQHIQNYVAQFFNRKTEDIIINNVEFINPVFNPNSSSFDDKDECFVNITVRINMGKDCPAALKHYMVEVEQFEGVVQCTKTTAAAYLERLNSK